MSCFHFILFVCYRNIARINKKRERGEFIFLVPKQYNTQHPHASHLLNAKKTQGESQANKHYKYKVTLEYDRESLQYLHAAI
jgi:hypothetical protein